MEESEYTGYDGSKLFLRIWKPEDEPKAAIVCLHGLGSHSGLISPVGEYFASSGYIIYAPDLRGFGHWSGIKGHVESLNEIVEDTNQLIQLVREKHPNLDVFLWGHSFGGLMTVLYCAAHQHEIDGFIIINPGLGERLEVSSFVRSIAKFLSALNIKKLFDNGLDLNLISRNPRTVQRNKEDPLRFDFATPRLAAEGFASVKRAMEKAVEIAIPALVQQSEADLIVLPEKTKEFYERLASADKTWRSYEDLYHEPFEEEGGEQVLKDAIEWVKNHLSTKE
ncbi:MAG: lysophospholipase [Candidatus Thorarchaeota archaeon]